MYNLGNLGEIQRIQRENREIINGLWVYFRSKTNAFIGHLYRYMRRGTAIERRQEKVIRRMRTREEKISFIRDEVKKPSFRYHSIKVRKYMKEIAFEKIVEESLKASREFYEEPLALESLIDLKKGEKAKLRETIRSMEREVPERVPMWAPRIERDIKRIEELIEELEKLKKPYIHIKLTWNKTTRNRKGQKLDLTITLDFDVDARYKEEYIRRGIEKIRNWVEVGFRYVEIPEEGGIHIQESSTLLSVANQLREEEREVTTIAYYWHYSNGKEESGEGVINWDEDIPIKPFRHKPRKEVV